jgi:hypothetical protein
MRLCECRTERFGIADFGSWSDVVITQECQQLVEVGRDKE